MIGNLRHRIIIITILLISLISTVAANTNVTFSQGLTFTTKYGLRVPFGLENIMPPAWAFLIYNGISLGLLFFIGGYASLRSTRFSIFCIDAFAAIFWWFGWMSFYQPATDTVNWWILPGILLLKKWLRMNVKYCKAQGEGGEAEQCGYCGYGPNDCRYV